MTYNDNRRRPTPKDLEEIMRRPPLEHAPPDAVAKAIIEGGVVMAQANGERRLGHWVTANYQWLAAMLMMLATCASVYGRVVASNDEQHRFMTAVNETQTQRIDRLDERWLALHDDLGQIRYVLGIPRAKGK